MKTANATQTCPASAQGAVKIVASAEAGTMRRWVRTIEASTLRGSPAGARRTRSISSVARAVVAAKYQTRPRPTVETMDSATETRNATISTPSTRLFMSAHAAYSATVPTSEVTSQISDAASGNSSDQVARPAKGRTARPVPVMEIPAILRRRTVRNSATPTP
ncbi:hypothetical protein NBM05_02520 [Rothia sp. AR01]|uniref:Uncharacterized protein n=1 Tax=Rothia santali TaxID=2949643 RepID=A0A9X2HC06_9MICC|nr:hypothetical protein [Rothia santali]MCP3424932.1 hypothetical protein [Rothia santali]